MDRIIGVLAVGHVATGVVEENRIAGSLRFFPPEEASVGDAFEEMAPDVFAATLAQEIEATARGRSIRAIGVGMPGIVRGGIIEESPNLQQLKGLNLQALLAGPAPVVICNDADAMAAGIAAVRGQLDRLIRVWTLGTGVGFGRYPWIEGVWEGGHSVVSLDPKERFCGCGGTGHLEGILGHRAMRLRFLDLEPEEVFANAKAGDERCASFVKLAHRALAAATATSVHMDGPGKVFITGPNARFIDLDLLNLYLHEMVKMSPLQGSMFEIISTTDEIGVIGAAVNAGRAVAQC
jgi:glucokinase